MVQGTGSGGATVTLYFDAETGLLSGRSATSTRRWAVSPRRWTTADYREVAGVKVPFKWTMTWLDGRDTVELTDVRANAPVDAARFTRPAPPVARQP